MMIGEITNHLWQSTVFAAAVALLVSTSVRIVPKFATGCG